MARRAPKRARALKKGAERSGVHRPGLFAPFRALGLVCDSVPFNVQRLGADNFLTTAVGRAFHVYNVRRELINRVVQCGEVTHEQMFSGGQAAPDGSEPARSG